MGSLGLRRADLLWIRSAKKETVKYKVVLVRSFELFEGFPAFACQEPLKQGFGVAVLIHGLMHLLDAPSDVGVPNVEFVMVCTFHNMFFSSTSVGFCLCSLKIYIYIFFGGGCFSS